MDRRGRMKTHGDTCILQELDDILGFDEDFAHWQLSIGIQLLSFVDLIFMNNRLVFLLRLRFFILLFFLLSFLWILLFDL